MTTTTIGSTTVSTTTLPILTRSTTFTANGRRVEPGTELSIVGHPGRYRFVEHVTTDKGAEWITCIGGRSGMKQWRSFAPSAIRTVHRIEKIR